ncbi:MAG: hypothetical protein WCE40_04605 [Polyangia bacterium]
MTFFPLGNADCCRIALECGKTMLVDFAALHDAGDPNDVRCDLPALLREDLKQRGCDFYDVVAFTHLDNDHIRGSTEFFRLDHAKKYQGDGRIAMNTMWVPAAMITEEAPDDEEARILQREARHRFKEGSRIRVFSRPDRLRGWCEKIGLKLEDRLALISDAGTLAPELTLASDGVEFFVHSPFAVRQNENTVEDRNEDSLLFQATFDLDGGHTRVLFLADSTCDVLDQIVDVTRLKKNDQRLEWDIAKLPHHCSYTAIGPEKGKDKTVPTDQVHWLYEKQGANGAIAVSTSKPIPVAGSKEDDDPQPPHRQAAGFYEDAVGRLDGQFVVTMEHPSARAPEPLVIEIGGNKATLKKTTHTAAGVATSRSAPRAG